MKKHKSSLLCLALLLGITVAGAYVSGVFAKYTGEVEGAGTATVAKWDFDVENQDVDFTVNLSETYDASTLANGKIAPGTEGSFNIALTNANTDTAVAFELLLEEIENKPTNLKFYSDAAHDNELTPGTGTITGKLAANDATGLTATVYWAWEFNGTDATTYDAADTTDGKAAADLTIGVSITGTQIQASTTAVTSAFN